MARITIAFLIWAALACAAACSTGEDEVEPEFTPSPTVPTQSARPPQTTTPGLPIEELCCADYFEQGKTVAAITRDSDFVIGHVTGIVLPYDPRPGWGGIPPETSPPGAIKDFHPTEEEINRPPGRPFTAFSFEVTHSGLSGLKPGDVITVVQLGGVWEGVQYQFPGNPLLENGPEYLLPILATGTIAELPDAYIMGAPFSAFVIDGETITPFDPAWLWMPAVAELSGKTPQDALATITAARKAATTPASES